MTQSPEARAARPEEAEEVLETLCAAFELNVDSARPIFYADPYYQLTHKRVLSVPNTGIVSCLTIVPALVRIGGAVVSAGGVAGVATRPAFQNRGYAAALLAATVPALWDELGYPVSFLHPVSSPFYRQLGWETASSHILWAAVPSSLPKHAESLFVRQAASGDWSTIAAIQADLTRDGTGTSARDSRRWALIQMVVPGRECYVYEDSAGICGYALWERGETLELLEMFGRTQAARRGLVGFLARQPDLIVHWASSPALLASFGFDPAGKQAEPDLMLRVVNLAASLSAVHAAQYCTVLNDFKTEITLQITDPLCLLNNRPLRLTPEGVEPGAEGNTPWLRTDIQTWGPHYLGYSLPSEAAARGLLTTDSRETLALADRLFPLRNPYVAPLDQS